jgi:hypothetical protein
MGALAGLVHLCHGRVRLLAKCCCDHKAPPPSPMGLRTSASTLRCCLSPAAQPPQVLATHQASESRWQAPVQALPPALPVLAPPPEPPLPPGAWARNEAIRRAHAPPLHLQLRIFLI